MITINLLPEEYRRRARTPMKMMLVISSVVAVHASLLAWWAWLAFGVSTEVETARGVLDMEIAGLRPQVAYHDKLVAEIATHSSREKPLRDLTDRRVLWTEVMDELIDVVYTGNEGVRHYIWFDDVTAKVSPSSPSNPSMASHGSLESASHSGSEVLSQVADFIEDLRDHELSDIPKMFHDYGKPSGVRQKSAEGLVPRVNFIFPLRLKLLSPQERKRLMDEEL